MKNIEWRKIFVLAILTFSYFSNYMLLHSALTPMIVIGIPMNLLVQVWMLYILDFYTCIFYNVFANAILFLLGSIFEYMNNHGFLYYLKNNMELAMFIVLFWCLSSTIYFGLLFQHWFTRVFIPFIFQLIIVTIYSIIAYYKFFWNSDYSNPIQMPIWGFIVNYTTISLIFLFSLMISKWYSTKIQINKSEVY